MESLRKRDLVGPLRERSQSGKLMVGICLGQQLLMTESHEFGRHRGLGLIDGDVVRFAETDNAGRPVKVPHVGWDRDAVTVADFTGLGAEDLFIAEACLSGLGSRSANG